MENDTYSLENKNKLISNSSVPNKKYTRKVYTDEQIKGILNDYMEIPKSKIITLKPGNTKVCYLRADDNSFCFGGYVTVNPIEKKDGTETYLQLRGNVRKQGKNNIQWLVAYSGISKIWIFVDHQLELVKIEIQKNVKKQREELSLLVDKISMHFRNMKREIRDLKKEIKQLKDETDDEKSVTTDFSTLRIYTDIPK